MLNNTFSSFESYIFTLHIPGVFLTDVSAVSLFTIISANMIIGLVALSTGMTIGAVFQYIFNVLRDVIQNNKLSQHLYAIIFSLFIYIGLWNIYGLTDSSFAITGHIIVTTTIALMIFFYGVVLAVRINYLDTFIILKSHGVPKLISPLIMVIETLSVSIRPLSLAVRLFANILAGHILLHMVYDTFSAAICDYNVFISLLTLFAFGAVFLLESAVALIQAFVYCLLSSVYIAELVINNKRFSTNNRFSYLHQY